MVSGLQSVQVAATADVRVSPKTQFDLQAYTKQQADLVNEALDRTVPLQHPESITDPMRCETSAASLLSSFSGLQGAVGCYNCLQL